MSISLTKEQSKVRLEKRTKEVSEVVKVNLTKHNLNPDTKARVAFVIDISGSMTTAYKRGYVQEIVEKIFPIAINFDDNAEMDVWIFEDGFRRMPAMNKDNYYGYVQREILDKNCKFGGTQYAPVLKDVAKYYLEEHPEPTPVYVIFITDGDNFDKSETTKVVKELSNYPIFLQFVGVGSAGFEYLEQLDDMSGRYVDNADFFEATYDDFSKENNLYQKLLQEYPSWLADNKVKDMIQNNFKREPKAKKGFLGLFG
jgi:von willebrand factor type A